MNSTAQLLEVAAKELSTSQTLLDAEKKRYESGISDFFVINIRERSLAEAQLKWIQSQLSHHIALADYYLATMNTDALGLANSS